jgi:hypothetical protein
MPEESLAEPLAFETLGLDADLRRGVRDRGVTLTTSVQSAV